MRPLEGSTSFLHWAVASRAHPDHAESGDRHVVAPFASGVLLGVIDGLGHGGEAAAVACAAETLVGAHRGDPVVDLVRRCHAALAATRGVVMSLASFDALERTLAWIAVGNVEGIILRADATTSSSGQRLLLRAGVVGYVLPELQASVVAVSPGDTLVLASDGIRADFGLHLDSSGSPRKLADRILTEHGVSADDALVLVARFRGGAP